MRLKNIPESLSKRQRPRFPSVPIFGFIAGVPEQFGGRTSVCLERADALAEATQSEIEILTVDPMHAISPETRTEDLRRAGRIGSRIRIRNLWADLRRANDQSLKSVGALGNVERSAPHVECTLPFNGRFQSTRESPNGKILQVDYFRDDGSCLVSLQNNVMESRKPGGSTIRLFSSDGGLLGQWDHKYLFYMAWLDWVIGGQEAVIICDWPHLSKSPKQYLRDNVVFIQAMHSKHFDEIGPVSTVLSREYIGVAKNVDKFDRLAVLTEGQKLDLLRLNIAKDNIEVLPNMLAPSVRAPLRDRSTERGILLSRLESVKRVDHAIESIARAKKLGGAAFSLDIFGEGRQSQLLARRIDELGLGGSVKLHGYDPAAKSRFAEASFSLLTSEFEGFSLVILESMAQGCIPIAYDVKYGPGEIIESGVNGFLVPDGDIHGLADAILSLSRMNRRKIAKMRAAAIRRSREFSQDAVLRRWARVLTSAVEEKAPASKPHCKATVQKLSQNGTSVRVRILITGVSSSDVNWVLLMWEQRGGRRYGRIDCVVEECPEGLTAVGEIPVSELETSVTRLVNFSIDMRVRSQAVRRRVQGLRRGEQVLTIDGVEFYGTAAGSLSARSVST